MKLCEVCDKPIKGRWCKNCHRFVTGYESNYAVYKQEESESAATEFEGTFKGSEKKKRKIFVWAIYGIMLLSFVIYMLPYIPNMIDTVRMISDSAEKKQEEKQAFFDDVTISDEEIDAYGDKVKREEAVQKLTPAERVVDNEHSVYYYEPEDIKAVGYPCDEMHLDLYFKEFEQWLNEHWTDSYEVDDDSSIYYNQCYIEDDYQFFRFATYRYYRNKNIMVKVEYDTATEQLHSVFIGADEVPGQLGYEMLKRLKPETQWTEEAFTEALQAAEKEDSAYSVFCREEGVVVALIQGSGEYSLAFIAVV